MDRTCRTCNQTKPLDDFYKNKRGHLWRCKECFRADARAKRAVDPDGVRAKERAYWQANPELKHAKNLRFYENHAEQRKQEARDWYAANPERVRENKRRYYAEHSEELIAYQHEYEKQNKERIRERRRDYYLRNRERILEKARLLRQRDPGAANSGPRRRRAQKRAIGKLLGFHTEAEWKAKLVEFGGKCAYCGTTENITRDHIVPLGRGGADTIDNIQPLCYSCNARKSARLI
jgi:5-methylcytosine-specific restriction endonuclease McrA